MQLKNSALLLLILPLMVALTIAGCTGSQEITQRDSKFNLQKKDVSAYKTQSEVVATNTFEQKTNLSKVSLESISSSITSIVASDLVSSPQRDALMYKIIELLNTPYVWGGTSRNGLDCSGFVQTVMYQALGIILPRTSYEQANVGEDVDPANLKFGDLLFFDTMNRGRVSHVGIYLGDGYFAHSGSRTGVAIASLNSDFYSRVFLKAKRILSTPIE